MEQRRVDPLFSSQIIMSDHGLCRLSLPVSSFVCYVLLNFLQQTQLVCDQEHPVIYRTFLNLSIASFIYSTIVTLIFCIYILKRFILKSSCLLLSLCFAELLIGTIYIIICLSLAFKTCEQENVFWFKFSLKFLSLSAFALSVLFYNSTRTLYLMFVEGQALYTESVTQVHDTSV